MQNNFNFIKPESECIKLCDTSRLCQKAIHAPNKRYCSLIFYPKAFPPGFTHNDEFSSINFKIKGKTWACECEMSTQKIEKKTLRYQSAPQNMEVLSTD